MKAITLNQPWASLIAEGFQSYEVRRWCPPRYKILQRIGIHAGGKHVETDQIVDLMNRLSGDFPGRSITSKDAIPFLESCLEDTRRLPRSAVICTAFLGRPRLAKGLCEGSSPISPRLWAWPLSDAQTLRVPARIAGQPDLWEWDQSHEPDQLL